MPPGKDGIATINLLAPFEFALRRGGKTMGFRLGDNLYVIGTGTGLKGRMVRWLVQIQQTFFRPKNVPANMAGSYYKDKIKLQLDINLEKVYGPTIVNEVQNELSPTKIKEFLTLDYRDSLTPEEITLPIKTAKSIVNENKNQNELLKTNFFSIYNMTRLDDQEQTLKWLLEKAGISTKLNDDHNVNLLFRKLVDETILEASENHKKRITLEDLNSRVPEKVSAFLSLVSQTLEKVQKKFYKQGDEQNFLTLLFLHPSMAAVKPDQRQAVMKRIVENYFLPPFASSNYIPIYMTADVVKITFFPSSDHFSFSPSCEASISIQDETLVPDLYRSIQARRNQLESIRQEKVAGLNEFDRMVFLKLTAPEWCGGLATIDEHVKYFDLVLRNISPLAFFHRKDDGMTLETFWKIVTREDKPKDVNQNNFASQLLINSPPPIILAPIRWRATLSPEAQNIRQVTADSLIGEDKNNFLQLTEPDWCGGLKTLNDYRQYQELIYFNVYNITFLQAYGHLKVGPDYNEIWQAVTGASMPQDVNKSNFGRCLLEAARSKAQKNLDSQLRVENFEVFLGAASIRENLAAKMDKTRQNIFFALTGPYWLGGRSVDGLNRICKFKKYFTLIAEHLDAILETYNQKKVLSPRSVWKAVTQEEIPKDINRLYFAERLISFDNNRPQQNLQNIQVLDVLFEEKEEISFDLQIKKEDLPSFLKGIDANKPSAKSSDHTIGIQPESKKPEQSNVPYLFSLKKTMIF